MSVFKTPENLGTAIPGSGNTQSVTDEYTPRMNYYEFKNLHRALKGRILTIVDASITDPVQRKAVKDVIKDTFYGQLVNVKTFYFHLDLLEDSVEGTDGMNS
jgi:hypothetical protein